VNRDTDDRKCAAEGDRKLPADDGQQCRAISGLPGELDPTGAHRDERSFPKVFNVEDDDEQVDITRGNQVSKFGEQFHLHTIIREGIFIGQKFADFNINISFSNLLRSICRRMAKKLGIDDDEIEDWWACTRQQVHQHLKLHRSNTI
jgi:hypothetical protein